MFLSDGKHTLTLSKFGRESSCEDWIVPTNTYISNVRVGYNSQGVTYMRTTTNKGVSFERGRIGSIDK